MAKTLDSKEYGLELGLISLKFFSGSDDLHYGYFTEDLKPTFSNLKTAQEFTKTQNFNATTLTDASTIAWDASANQVTSVTLGASRTLGAATNQVDGAVYVLTVIQDGSGSRTLSFNSNYKFTGGTAPTLTTTAAARDILVFTSNGTNMFEIGRSLNVS